MFRVASYTDIAGQVTASSANADRVTVGSVYLPAGGLKAIRKQVSSSFPKWRDATDGHLEHIVKLLLKEALSVSVGSVDKTTEEWGIFWKDASETHRRAASIQGDSIGFLKAATLIKLMLFGCSGAAALGHAVSTGMIPRLRSRRGRIEVEEVVVLDNEIQGKYNRDALIDIWRAINGHQPLSHLIGVTRTAKTLQLTSEQSEPLLLLADYVAGIVHAEKSQADVLQHSKVSPEAAAAGLLLLRKAGKLIDFSDTVDLKYFEIFPDFENLSRRGAT